MPSIECGILPLLWGRHLGYDGAQGFLTLSHVDESRIDIDGLDACEPYHVRMIPMIFSARHSLNSTVIPL